MKKIVCLLIVIAMSVSLIASAAGEYDFLSQKYESYEAESVITMKLNKPLKILDAAKEAGLFENAEAFIDVKAFAESLFNGNHTFNIAYKIYENKKGMEMAVLENTKTALTFNRNLKADLDAKTGMWIKIDVSDPENPIYDLILLPATEKYIVMKTGDLLESKEEKDAFSKMMSTAFEMATEEDNSEYIKAIINNAEIKTGRGVCSVEYDTKGLLGMLKEVYAALGQDFDLPETIPADINIHQDYILNASKQIKETNSDIRISLNVYDIISSLGGEESVGNLTHENSDIDITIHEESAYKNINRVKKVAMPELTGENSVNLEDLFPNEYGYYYWRGNTNDIKEENGQYYFSLENIIADNNLSRDFKISYNGNLVNVSNKKSYGEMLFNTADKTVSVNGGAAEAADIFLSDGKIYLNADTIKMLFVMKLDTLDYDLVEKEYFYSFERDYSYDYDYDYDYDYEDSGNEEEKEANKTSYYRYWVGTAKNIIRENGKVYLPFRELLIHGFPEGTYTLNYDAGNIYFRNEGYYGDIIIDTNNKTATKNGRIDSADIIMKNGSTYLSTGTLFRLFEMSPTEINYNYMIDEYRFCFQNYQYSTYMDLGGWSEDAFEENGELYIPFRRLIEMSEDEGTYSIEYKNGIILYESDKFKKMELDSVNKTALLPDGEKTDAQIVIKDGKTYISSGSICKIFGMNIDHIERNCIDGYYSYLFSK